MKLQNFKCSVDYIRHQKRLSVSGKSTLIQEYAKSYVVNLIYLLRKGLVLDERVSVSPTLLRKVIFVAQKTM